MPYIGLNPGDKVTVTFDGVLAEVWSDGARVSVRDDHGADHLVTIPTEADAVSIVVGELPEAWPPQPGDIWHLFSTAATGNPTSVVWESWHALAVRSYVHGRGAMDVQMVNPHVPGYARRAPQELLDEGELRLVWRGEAAVIQP